MLRILFLVFSSIATLLTAAGWWLGQTSKPYTNYLTLGGVYSMRFGVEDTFVWAELWSDNRTLASQLTVIRWRGFMMMARPNYSASIWLRYIPLWAPTFGVTATWTLWTLLVLSGHPLRRKRGFCVKCGYDLTGNESGVCSECGSERS